MVAIGTHGLTGTDVIALVMGMLAFVFISLHRRSREPGLVQFATGFAIMAVWWATNEVHVPAGEYFTRSPWLVLTPIACVFFNWGFVDYLDIPAQRRRVWLALLNAPLAAVLAILAWIYFLDARVVRYPVNVLLTLTFVGDALMCMGAARREPRAGHGYIAAALFSLPIINIIGRVLLSDTLLLRYLGGLPLIFLGIIMLTVSLLRRQRHLQIEIAQRIDAEQALAQLNTSLETEVERRTQDLKDVISGLETFSRSVSHDLRGPLGGIADLATMAHTAWSRGDDSLAKRALPMIASQAKQSSDLVDALLRLARASDAPVHAEPVDLTAATEDAAAQYAIAHPAAALPKITVMDMPAVLADAELLQAMLTNLVGNAIKFSSERTEPRIEVSATANATEVTVRVSDNGAGFDSATADRLFHTFSRLHGSRFTGTGIGLAIVRRAVERQGGRVWAEGAPEQGARFYFTLPRAPVS